jgi:hypothetical protein
VQSSSRVTSHAALNLTTAEPRHANPTELAYPRRASPRKDEFNLFDLGPHTCRAYDSVRYWVSRVAEIQRGLSLANCLIDVAVRRRRRMTEERRTYEGSAARHRPGNQYRVSHLAVLCLVASVPTWTNVDSLDSYRVNAFDKSRGQPVTSQQTRPIGWLNILTTLGESVSRL